MAVTTADDSKAVMVMMAMTPNVNVRYRGEKMLVETLGCACVLSGS